MRVSDIAVFGWGFASLPVVCRFRLFVSVLAYFNCADCPYNQCHLSRPGHSLEGGDWSKVPWSLKQINDWGYSRVSVVNATAMKLEWVRNRSYHVDDFVWLYK